MSQWILVFVPSDLNPRFLAKVLSECLTSSVSLWTREAIIDIVMGRERVQLDWDPEGVDEYCSHEIKNVLSVISCPSMYRLSYYRGTILLKSVLETLGQVDQPIFVDNDHGAIMRLENALALGLSDFLALHAR